MPESNRRLLLRTRHVRKEKDSNHCGDLCFHRWFSIAAARSQDLRSRAEIRITLTNPAADKYIDHRFEIFPRMQCDTDARKNGNQARLARIAESTIELC
jgi:hypothetical protein